MRKPGIWCFFVKVEFDVCSTIELSFVVEIVFDRATPPIIEELRSKGARGWRFCILCVNWKSIEWTWENFIVDDSQSFF